VTDLTGRIEELRAKSFGMQIMENLCDALVRAVEHFDGYHEHTPDDPPGSDCDDCVALADIAKILEVK